MPRLIRLTSWKGGLVYLSSDSISMMRAADPDNSEPKDNGHGTVIWLLERRDDDNVIEVMETPKEVIHRLQHDALEF